MNVIDAIVNAVKPTPPQNIDPLAAVAARIIELAKAKIGSDSEREAVGKFSAAYKAGLKVIETYNYATAHKAWIEHREALAKAAADGTIAELDAWSEDELHADHVGKMEGGKCACRNAGNACIPLARKLAADFAEIADQFAAEQVKAERDAYARFGVEYPGPSALVRHLQQAGATAKGRIPGAEATAGTGPSVDSMLAFLNL